MAIHLHVPYHGLDGGAATRLAFDEKTPRFWPVMKTPCGWAVWEGSKAAKLRLLWNCWQKVLPTITVVGAKRSSWRKAKGDNLLIVLLGLFRLNLLFGKITLPCRRRGQRDTAEGPMLPAGSVDDVCLQAPCAIGAATVPIHLPPSNMETVLFV